MAPSGDVTTMPGVPVTTHRLTHQAIAYTDVSVAVSVTEVHVTPLLLKYIWGATELPASHWVPLYATAVSDGPMANPVHVVPSVEDAAVHVPVPTAIHFPEPHAIPAPRVKIVRPTPVHVVPSVEEAMEFVPAPVATHRVPFQATAVPSVEKMAVPIPVHETPSAE
jgi:hypothetical protein